MEYLDGMDIASSFYEKYGLAAMIFLNSDEIEDRVLVAATLIDLEKKGKVRFEEGFGFEIIDNNLDGLLDHENLVLSLLEDGRINYKKHHNIKRAITKMLSNDNYLFLSNDKNGAQKRQNIRIAGGCVLLWVLASLASEMRISTINYYAVISLFVFAIVALVFAYLIYTVTSVIKGEEGYEMTLEGNTVKKSLDVMAKSNKNDILDLVVNKKDGFSSEYDSYVFRNVKFLDNNQRQKLVQFVYYVRINLENDEENSEGK